MSKVVSLSTYKLLKELNNDELDYRAMILSMTKAQLLEEMVRFQEVRKVMGQLDEQMMVRGRILYRAIEEAADTPELKMLSRSYRRHLEYEIAAIRENKNNFQP